MPTYTQAQLDMDLRILNVLKKVHIPVSIDFIRTQMKVGRLGSPTLADFNARIGVLRRCHLVYTTLNGRPPILMVWRPDLVCSFVNSSSGPAETYDNTAPDATIVALESVSTLTEEKLEVLPASSNASEPDADEVEPGPTDNAVGQVLADYLKTCTSHMSASQLVARLSLGGGRNALKLAAIRLSWLWRKGQLERCFDSGVDELVYWHPEMPSIYVKLAPSARNSNPTGRGRKHAPSKNGPVTHYLPQDQLQSVADLPPVEIPDPDPVKPNYEVEKGDESRGQLSCSLQADQTLLLNWPDHILALTLNETLSFCEFFQIVSPEKLAASLRCKLSQVNK